MDFAETPMLWGNKVCYSCTGDATLKTSVHQLLLITFFCFYFCRTLRVRGKLSEGSFLGEKIVFLWGFFITKKTIWIACCFRGKVTCILAAQEEFFPCITNLEEALKSESWLENGSLKEVWMYQDVATVQGSYLDNSGWEEASLSWPPEEAAVLGASA